jgi:hypothetical protein
MKIGYERYADVCGGSNAPWLALSYRVLGHVGYACLQIEQSASTLDTAILP